MKRMLRTLWQLWKEALAELIRRMDDWTARMNEYNDSRRKRPR